MIDRCFSLACPKRNVVIRAEDEKCAIKRAVGFVSSFMFLDGEIYLK